MSEIRVERLTKTFKQLTAVDDITFRFAESEVTCLLGPSGCGKTTLMRMIAGLEKPTSGEIYFGEQRVTRLKPSQRDIGMVFQYPVVYRGISVYRNIELPLLGEKLTKPEREHRIMTVAEILNLREHLDKDITQLDNGTRQKVAVARAVARQSKIILFDEPITNVDAHAKMQLKRAFKDLTKQLKQTIVYVTHDQTEAMTLADQIALMKDGKIVQRDAPRVLYNHPADRFGGWFLGNPGMNFFDATIESQPDGPGLLSPLFPAPVPVAGECERPCRVVVGIRPERLLVSSSPSASAVEVSIARKSITVGRQYLLSLEREGELFKAKTPSEIGRGLGSSAWVELPLADIVIFDDDGRRAGFAPRAADLPIGTGD